MNQRLSASKKKEPKPNRAYLGIKIRRQDREEWDRFLREDDLLHAPQLFAKMIDAYKEKYG